MTSDILRSFFKPLKDIFLKTKPAEGVTTIVSGLPRSGTSMMMQILEAGGLTPVTDNVRLADASNAKGYYEHEAVKALSKGDYRCLLNAEGCAIKIISSLLMFLPSDRQYKIIFMRRDINQILKSQTAMLHTLNKEADSSSDHKMKILYSQHLHKVSKWIESKNNIDVLYIDYDQILEKPSAHIHKLKNFIDQAVDTRKMTTCIDKRMRHN